MQRSLTPQQKEKDHQRLHDLWRDKDSLPEIKVMQSIALHNET